MKTLDQKPFSTLLEALSAAAGRGRPPVDSWNPPECGDIGLAIGADGTWAYLGSPILRPGLVRLFASVLRREADGRTFLVTPAEKVLVHVADAPFLAVEMELAQTERGDALVFRTNVDDVVICDREHPLRFDVDPNTGAVKPYVRVRGRLDALLTRALTYEVLELAMRNSPPAIHSCGEVFVLPRPGASD